MDDTFIDVLAETTDDPLAFVMWAYPWGEEGTELARSTGPDYWQLDVLRHIRDELQKGNKLIKIAVKSGHGVGKSAFSSMIADWAMSTLTGARGVVTANTERQLRTRSWVELAKWRRLSLTREMFKFKATSMHSVDPQYKDEWRYDMSPWSERNTEAFAGLHNEGKRLILIMDESSNIPDIVHEVAEGAMTDKDTEIIWIMLGNPTRNTGRFREAFDDGKFAHNWFQMTVDSRKSKLTNKELIAQWEKDYGLDHDFFRVRVLGEFPKHDVSSFIDRAVVMNALDRKPEGQQSEPVVIGVDVARFGDDRTVLFPRRGRDARTMPVEMYQSLDTMQVAERAAAMCAKYNAQMIYVDGGGLGAGVVDRLRQLRFPVHEVNFGDAPNNYNQVETGIRYANKRAEVWGGMRDWLHTGSLQNVVVDTDYTILDDLTLTQYYYNSKDCIQLELKSEIKRREGRSPDLADALACTFAAPFLHQHVRSAFPAAEAIATNEINYNPYAAHRRYING